MNVAPRAVKRSGIHPLTENICYTVLSRKSGKLQNRVSTPFEQGGSGQDAHDSGKNKRVANANRARNARPGQ